ncbi:MAG TPA: sugar ABC transporter permease [Clostridiales bacterium]|nr:sugar ABC transporter permease [Clostridiales bacterium]
MAKSNSSRAIVNRNRLMALGFLSPNIFGFLIFTLIPAVWAIGMSFTNWEGSGTAEFIGIGNYARLFSDSGFKISLGNTLFYTIGTVPFIIIISMILAFVLESGLRFATAIRAAHFFPHISSIVAIAVVWQFLYSKNGPLNQILRSIGIENPPAWLSDSKWALTAIMFMIIWKGIGYYMIIYLAGLRNIDSALYEAAHVDGANKFRQFIHITIPQLRPVTFYITIMAIINSFQVFTPIYVMTKGGPGRATSVLVLQIYKDAFQNYRFGYASAEAMVLFAIILIVTLIQFKSQKAD